MMMNNLFIRIVLILLSTTTIVISQEETHDDQQVAVLADDQHHHQQQQQLKTNRTCFCTEDEDCDGNTRTCRLYRADQTCYASWTLESSHGTIRYTAGCMLNDYFFVRLMCSVNQTNRVIVCCSQRDHCNDLDAYSEGIRTTFTTTTSKPPPRDGTSMIIIIIVISTISALVFLGVCFVLYIKQRRLRDRRTTYAKTIAYAEEQKKDMFLQRLWKCFNFRQRLGSNDDGRIPSDQSLTGLLVELSTSTMGPALPLLMQRTLARQITLEEQIGTGRYGSVHRGKWREDHVAVKIFSANDERSWFREIDIYQTVCLRHEHILGYIAADNMDASTYTQLWLVTEYHENGSVYDYLMNHTITIPILLKMMLSIASGLCHLHMPIESTNGKVALAHRDLKTKNILVKKDLSCCIADLGLAVKEVRFKPKSRKDALLTKNSSKEAVVIDIQANNRVGTTRYMAPEVLDGTLNEQNFESFKAADIYALGLCYWEMMRRCRISPTENDVDPYQVPYEDIQPNNPTAEQMREVVCTNKIRPSPSARWQTHPIVRQLVRLCEELWLEDPTCRLPSLTIKKQLKKHLEQLENDYSNGNIESQQQSTPNEGPWTA